MYNFDEVYSKNDQFHFSSCHCGGNIKPVFSVFHILLCRKRDLGTLPCYGVLDSI